MSERVAHRRTAVYCLWLAVTLPVVSAHGAAAQLHDTPEVPVAEALFPELDRILQTALRQSPSMLASRLAQLRSEQLTYVSSAPLYPSANAYWDFFLQREDRLNNSTDLIESTNTEKSYYSIAASQPLFHWGALRANAEIGKIAAEIAANNYVDAYRSLALQVRSQYLSLILGRKSLVQSESALATRRERLDAVRIAVDAGFASRGAVSSAEYSITQSELALDRERYAFENAVTQFARLTGDDSFDADRIPSDLPEIEPLPENVTLNIQQEYVTTGAYRESPDYSSAELRLEQERLNKRIQDVTTRPKVDLRAGITQDERSDTADVGDRYQFTATYVGLGITWNIFDGFAGRGRRLASATALRQLENTLEQTEINLVAAAERAWQEVDFARRALAFAERSLRRANSSLDRRRDDAELGRVSQDEIVDAEQSLATAEQEACAARMNYLNALAAFLSAVNADPAVDAARLEISTES